MAKILAPQWDMIEKQYVDNSKVVFRNIREERERIIRYFYQIRKDYKSYLRRPDSKQEFVSAWQKVRNIIYMITKTPSDLIIFMLYLLRQNEYICPDVYGRVVWW